MEMKLSGLKEVEDALIRLGAVAGERVMRQSLFAAVKPIMEASRANIAHIEGGSGALHESIGRTFRKTIGLSAAVSGQGTRFVIQIGPRINSRAAISLYNLYYHRHIRGIFYGHLVEFGHRVAKRGGGYLKKLNRPNGKGAIAIGFVRPQPFLRPALESKSLQATFIFSNQVKRRAERALKKLDPGVDSV